MQQTTAVSSSPYSIINKTFEKPKIVKNITYEEFEHEKTALNESIDSKIKIAVLNIKLWVVTAVVVFLVGSGSTFMCAMRTAGNVEAQINNIAEKQHVLETQVESLRKEIWDRIPIPSARNREGEINNASTTIDVVTNEKSARL